MACQRVGGFLIRCITIIAATLAVLALSFGSSPASPTTVGWIDHGVVKVKKPPPAPRHNQRWHVAMTLKHGLAGTPLANEYWHMELWAHRWNVSPYLVAGISGTESSFGAAACGHNAWGINSCNGVYFTSWNEGIRYTSQLLRTGYLAQGLTSLDSIGRTYCGLGCTSWAGNTRYFMGRFGASGDWLTYPG